jgi:Helix-turn-helix domain
MRGKNLSPDQVAEIKRLRGAGWGLRAIADELGVSIQSASRYGQLPAPRRRPICTDLSGFVQSHEGSFIAPPSLARLMAGR